jgi:hypothetical protein
MPFGDSGQSSKDKLLAALRLTGTVLSSQERGPDCACSGTTMRPLRETSVEKLNQQGPGCPQGDRGNVSG